MFKNNKPDALKREMTGLCKILGRPDIRTTFSGTGAYTNNKVVNLPALSDNKAIPPSEQMVIRGAQVHETGHVIHTDWAYCKPLMKRMKGSEHFNFNACEDVMTEHLPIKVYQGAKKNLDALNERTLSRENQFYKDHPEKQAARVETWWHEIPYAALQTCRGEIGYENAALAEYLGSLCPELVKAVKKYVKPLLGATDTRENMKISRRMNKEIAKLQAEYDAAREEEEEEEEDDIMPPPPPPPYDDEPEPIIEGDDEQVEEDEDDGDGDGDNEMIEEMTMMERTKGAEEMSKMMATMRTTSLAMALMTETMTETMEMETAERAEKAMMLTMMAEMMMTTWDWHLMMREMTERMEAMTEMMEREMNRMVTQAPQK